MINSKEPQSVSWLQDKQSDILIIFSSIDLYYIYDGVHYKRKVAFNGNYLHMKISVWVMYKIFCCNFV